MSHLGTGPQVGQREAKPLILQGFWVTIGGAEAPDAVNIERPLTDQSGVSRKVAAMQHTIPFPFAKNAQSTGRAVKVSGRFVVPSVISQAGIRHALLTPAGVAAEAYTA